MNAAVTKLRQGVDLVARQLGRAPEMRAARAVPTSRGNAAGGPHVLVLSPRDWAVHVQWEALVARALESRGARVTVATCGGGLETCDRVNVHEGPPPPCRTCTRYTGAALAAHSLTVETLAPDFGAADWPELDGLTVPELRTVAADGLPLGALVDVPVKWFLCSAALDTDPLAASTYRAFLRSARRIARSVRSLVDRARPEVVLLLNGMFLFEAVAGAIARERGIRVVTYERAQIDGLLFFAHDEPASRYASEERWKLGCDEPLTPTQEEALDRYLADRRRGLRSFVQIWPSPQSDPEGRPEVPGARRRAVVFTNLTWDSAAIGLEGAYADVRDWLVAVVADLASHPEYDVVVRLHPSEVVLPTWRTREPMRAVLDRAFPELPAHVRIVDPSDPVSSYGFIDTADVGFAYTSTAGLELALAGVPVVLGGRPHYAGKGFTLDPRDTDEHRAVVAAVLADPAAHAPGVETARRYAHQFFFSANLPRPPAWEPVSGLARLEPGWADQLAPGAHAGLDAICDGILTGAPFEVPA